MITIFNRAILVREPNSEAASKVWSALRDAGIPYKVKNDRSGPVKAAVDVPRSGRTGNMTSGYSGGVYAGGGIPQSWSRGGSSSTVYIIYVLKKDLKRAKEICDIG